MLDLIEQQKVQEAEEAAEAVAKAEGAGDKAENLPQAGSARARLMAGEANKANVDTTLASASAALWKPCSAHRRVDSNCYWASGSL